jgi:hypothetical protein
MHKEKKNFYYNYLVDPEPLEGGSTPGGLVGDHAPDRPPKDLCRGAVVDRALLGVGGHPLLEEIKVPEQIAPVRTSDVQVLAPILMAKA